MSEGTKTLEAKQALAALKAASDKVAGILGGAKEIELTDQQKEMARSAGLDEATVQTHQQAILIEQAKEPGKPSRELKPETIAMAQKLAGQVGGKPAIDLEALKKHHSERFDEAERIKKEGYRPRGGKEAAALAIEESKAT